MTHKIRQINDPLLHHPVAAVDVNSSDIDLQNTLRIMRDNLNKKGGVGIAANQCAAFEQPLRIMIAGVYDEALLDLLKIRYPDREPPHARIMINPRIISLQGDPYFPGEGCMSVAGGMRAKVGRYPKVEVEFQDEQGIQHHEVIEGFSAHIVQHECDHLDGIIYLERAFSELADSDLQDISREITRELQHRKKTGVEPEISQERHFAFDRDTKDRLIVVQAELAKSISTMPSITLEGIVLFHLNEQDNATKKANE